MFECRIARGPRELKKLGDTPESPDVTGRRIHACYSLIGNLLEWGCNKVCVQVHLMLIPEPYDLLEYL